MLKGETPILQRQKQTYGIVKVLLQWQKKHLMQGHNLKT